MTVTEPTCRLCGEPVHVDCYGTSTHRDGLGSHDPEPVTVSDCQNEEWAAENGESVEWARTMWWCPCDDCLTIGLTASPGTCFGEQVRLRPVSPDVSRRLIDSRLHPRSVTR